MIDDFTLWEAEYQAWLHDEQIRRDQLMPRLFVVEGDTLAEPK